MRCRVFYCALWKGKSEVRLNLTFTVMSKQRWIKWRLRHLCFVLAVTPTVKVWFVWKVTVKFTGNKYLFDVPDKYQIEVVKFTSLCVCFKFYGCQQVRTAYNCMYTKRLCEYLTIAFYVKLNVVKITSQ